MYLRKLTAGLGVGESSPTLLHTDSKAARDVSYNPEQHDRMKHVQRRHFFVRDMVETFDVSNSKFLFFVERRGGRYAL